MLYTQTCSECAKEFESKRPASLCSSTCRSRANRATDKLSVATDNATDNSDYTRKMVEDRLKTYGGFIPNWYRLGYESRNAAMAALEKKL